MYPICLGHALPILPGKVSAGGKGVLLSPIAFVSEHVETLVELDHEYAELAGQVGCAPYLRTPALGVEPGFIRVLAAATLEALGRTSSARPSGPWLCPDGYGRCACRNQGVAA